MSAVALILQAIAIAPIVLPAAVARVMQARVAPTGVVVLIGGVEVRAVGTALTRKRRRRRRVVKAQRIFALREAEGVATRLVDAISTKQRNTES